MKLSEVPFTQLVTTENWLTGVNGKKGTIAGINVVQSGKFFETYLDIKWDNGTMSYSQWPHECNKVEVADPQPTQCSPYIDNQKALMEANIRYLEACRVKVFTQPA